MEKEFVTAVPAYGAASAGTDYLGLMPLIGPDMADEYMEAVSLTLVRGGYTTWTELHRQVFRADPVSDLTPRELNGGAYGSFLFQAWEAWVSESTREMEAVNKQRGMSIESLELLVRWTGVTPFKVTASTCHVCVSPGRIIPVLSHLCWPVNDVGTEQGQWVWEPRFPADHLRAEVEQSHDHSSNKLREHMEALWKEWIEGGWTPYRHYEETDDGSEEMWKDWTITDLIEHGYDEDVYGLEEEAMQTVSSDCALAHSSIVFIPHRVLSKWSRALDMLSNGVLLSRYYSGRQIVQATIEGLRAWREATDHSGRQ